MDELHGTLQEPVLLQRLMAELEKTEATEHALADQLHFLQILIDSIPLPIFYKDTEARYRGCNIAFAQYLGKAPQEIIGKSVYDLSPPHLAAIYHAKDADLFSNPGAQTYETDVRYADGTLHQVIFNKATYHDRNKQLAGLVGVIIDITERKHIEDALAASTRKLEQVMDQIVHAMASITETRDMYTAGHQTRVAELAVAIGNELALPKEDMDCLYISALLHDIGKMGIPIEILNKPAALTPLEYELVKMHSKTGYDILRTIDFPYPVAETVYQHHERLDGTGYPRGLKAPDILVTAQILAVADTVEAMASHRPYRPGLGMYAALAEITQHEGARYASNVVQACVAVIKKGLSFSI